MLGWLGLLGKVVEFSITKIAERKIDLALDQRKQAAKAFLSLHESLEQLEQAALEFIYQSQHGLLSENRRVLYRVPIEKISKDVDDASSAFFKSFSDLRQIISLYDEDLHRMLWGIQIRKSTIASLLMDLSTLRGNDSFKVSTDSSSIFSINYSAPSKELLSANLEKLYQNADLEKLRQSIQVIEELNFSDIQSQKSTYRASNKWTQYSLLSLVQNPTINARFSDDDKEYITHFVEFLNQHIKLLQSARQSLSEFIKENFSFDDLLYFKTLPKRY